ncbi:MAG: S8 family serine peptidase [Chloroflexota bacterium]
MDRKRICAIARVVVLVAALSAFMVSPALGQRPARVKVLIGFTHQPGRAEQALVHRAGGTIKYTYHLVPAIAATLPEAAIPGLLANPNVTRIEPDSKVWAVDTELDNTWGVKRIGAGTVHDGGNKGLGVKVAIIDSGIDYTHPDLDANYAGGWDFVNGDNDPDDPTHDGPMDDHGHGTHVAGSVAAEDNDVGVVGVAPEAHLYGLKVLGADGSGSYSDVIAALEWAVDNGIQVTNNSYGSSGDPGELVKAAFDNAYAAGVLNVCAAGNSGDPPGRLDSVIYPARYESCIAVAATDQSDERPRWSSTGPDLELSAPGVDINSTLLGGGYGAKSGTSMASPHVAGTAALVIAGGITDDNSDGYVNDEVRQRLIETADDLGDPERDTKYGYGLVDADEAAPPPAGNRAPVANAGSDQSVKTDSTVQLDGSGSSDPDGDPITYSWAFVSKPTSSTTTLSGADPATPTFVADVDGTYEVELTVSDGELSSTDTVVVTAAANRAPVANAGSDQSVKTGSTVQLDGSNSSDPDGDPITYSWAFVSEPADSSATLSGADTATPTFVADMDGTYEVELAVSDGELSSSDSVVVTAATATEATAVIVTLPSGTDGYATEGGRDGKKHLNITVALVDDLGSPVSGASVSIDLYLDGSLYASGTGTTGTDGTVTFKVLNAPSGTYTTTVTDLTAAGLTWDGVTPENGFTK